jgi:N6-L-threonylcarbamoyladenine synthase
MASACFLGVDTSNYTTSLAVVDDRLTVLANLKYPLPVKEGERGLRQSDALFAHTKQLPGAFAELRSLLTEYQPLAVGVSERPRNRDGSYMPCFLAGVSAAEAAAATENNTAEIIYFFCPVIDKFKYAA